MIKNYFVYILCMKIKLEDIEPKKLQWEMCISYRVIKPCFAVMASHS